MPITLWTQCLNSAVTLLQMKPDDRPPHVVTVLMQELSVNGENDWAEHLLGEMVEGVSQYANMPEALLILKESLALPCLTEETVREHLKVGATPHQPDISVCGLRITHALLVGLASGTWSDLECMKKPGEQAARVC